MCFLLCRDLVSVTQFGCYSHCFCSLVGSCDCGCGHVQETLKLREEHIQEQKNEIESLSKKLEEFFHEKAEALETLNSVRNGQIPLEVCVV